ncbi:MAG: DUF5132 domain-containing protein [Desulfomonilaceae bacterium]
MASWDFTPKGSVWTGVAIGVGLLVAPVVIPMIATAARPVAKAGIKGSLMLYEKCREMIAEVAEVVEDLAAEAKSEVQAELTPAKVKGA